MGKLSWYHDSLPTNCVTDWVCAGGSGYVDAEEVFRIAGFIASLDPSIPYDLPAFQPRFILSDLPLPTREFMDACLKAARLKGLTNLRVSNPDLIQ
ncbi:MAG: hypothetical protein HPY65_15155 [Syntrophaceae bacterium]|nr:hypothetical protein [Syntrophaceae bacterium]